MLILALILAAGGILCAVFASRLLAAGLLGGALVLFLLSGGGPGSGGVGGGGGPWGYVAVAPRAAPAASFKDANGARLSLEDFRGKVVLVNIWATWCGPCRMEMPSLNRLQARHRADGLEVVAVSVDREGVGKIRTYYGQRNLNALRIYLDDNRSTSAAFRPDGIPMSILIDREGNIVGTLTGATEWDSPAALELVGRYLNN
jgi:thiol-disulfide isomerase/thioredoxin